MKGTKQNPKNVGLRDYLESVTDRPQLRTAPQSSDQSFETHDNQSLLVCAQPFGTLIRDVNTLQVSMETKKPIRVIRGYKLHSRYAPLEGYRYDGLYTVEEVCCPKRLRCVSHSATSQAWMETGLNNKGLKVCKFAFKVSHFLLRA